MARLGVIRTYTAFFFLCKWNKGDQLTDNHKSRLSVSSKSFLTFTFSGLSRKVCIFAALCPAFSKPTIITHTWNSVHSIIHVGTIGNLGQPTNIRAPGTFGCVWRVIPLLFTLLPHVVTQNSYYTPLTVFMARLHISVELPQNSPVVSLYFYRN